MSLILFRGEHVSNNQEQHYITDGGANAKKVEADFPKVLVPLTTIETGGVQNTPKKKHSSASTSPLSRPSLFVCLSPSLKKKLRTASWERSTQLSGSDYNTVLLEDLSTLSIQHAPCRNEFNSHLPYTLGQKSVQLLEPYTRLTPQPTCSAKVSAKMSDHEEDILSELSQSKEINIRTQATRALEAKKAYEESQGTEITRSSRVETTAVYNQGDRELRGQQRDLPPTFLAVGTTALPQQSQAPYQDQYSSEDVVAGRWLRKLGWALQYLLSILSILIKKSLGWVLCICPCIVGFFYTHTTVLGVLVVMPVVGWGFLHFHLTIWGCPSIDRSYSQSFTLIGPVYQPVPICSLDTLSGWELCGVSALEKDAPAVYWVIYDRQYIAGLIKISHDLLSVSGLLRHLKFVLEQSNIPSRIVLCNKLSGVVEDIDTMKDTVLSFTEEYGGYFSNSTMPLRTMSPSLSAAYSEASRVSIGIGYLYARLVFILDSIVNNIDSNPPQQLEQVTSSTRPIHRFRSILSSKSSSSDTFTASAASGSSSPLFSFSACSALSVKTMSTNNTTAVRSCAKRDLLSAANILQSIQHKILHAGQELQALGMGLERIGEGKRWRKRRPNGSVRFSIEGSIEWAEVKSEVDREVEGCFEVAGEGEWC